MTQTNFISYFIKWTVSIQRTIENGAEGFYRNREEEEEKRKYLIGWGHTVELAWGREA